MDPQFQCVYCTEMFGDLTTLRNHMKTDDLRNRQCPRCDRLLHSRKCFAFHRQSMHVVDDNDRIACTMCELKFANLSELRQHRRVAHTICKCNESIQYNE